MSDTELLELAAKAAGLELQWNERWPVGACFMRRVHDAVHPDSEWLPWNPLEEDNDAFRLAVKLCMDVFVAEREVAARNIDRFAVIEETKSDPYAAARRAIVRAAAEIGKAMP